MLIVARWVTFLIYLPLRAVYRRWGWWGILIGLTAFLSIGGLAQYMQEGDSGGSGLGVLVGGILFITFLLWWRRGSAGRFPHETFSPADEIAGRGVLAMDLVFCRYLGAVMRVWGKNDKELVAAIHEHSRRLQDADPKRAWNYREAMLKQSTADWPTEARIRMGLELQEEWVPSAEDAENWATLSPAVRSSYVRQGMLMNEAYVTSFQGSEG